MINSDLPNPDQPSLHEAGSQNLALTAGTESSTRGGKILQTDHNATMGGMQLFLRKLDGRTAVLPNVATGADVHEAALAVHGSELSHSELRVVAGNCEVPNDDTALSTLEIEENWTVDAVGRLLGGGKKRKKKTYTKPKKIKHKHKKVKLAVLKYYKITDGKLERLRRECPADTCGAGVFMAAHGDRVYCGKCGLTYVHEK